LVSHFEGGTQTEGFENRVLRKIFGPEREEDGSWRKLHNEELHSLYSSPNIVRVIKSRRMRWAGHVARIGEGRDVCRVLVGRPEGKRLLGRPRRSGCGGEQKISLLGIDHGSMSYCGCNETRLEANSQYRLGSQTPSNSIASIDTGKNFGWALDLPVY
jgi:hypothetical protein